MGSVILVIIIVAAGALVLSGGIWLVSPILRRQPTSPAVSSPEPPVVFAGSPPQVASIGSDDMPIKIIFDDLSDSAIELMAYQPAPLDQCEEVMLSSQQRASLSSLVQHAGALGPNIHSALSRTYTVTFSPQVQQQLNQGTLKMMQAQAGGWRALAVNKDGRIAEQATLELARSVQVVAVVSAVWQVMAVVTAQVYLADISRRLARLERGIDDIKAWLEADKVATLLSARTYVQSIANDFAQSNLSENDIAVFAGQLEQHWGECAQIGIMFRLMMEQRRREFEQLNLSSTWGLDEQVREAKQAISEYERLAQVYMLSVQTRDVLVRGRAILPLSRDIVAQRSKLLQDEFVAWSTERSTFFQMVQTHVTKHLSALIHIGTSNETYRRKVRATAEDAQRGIARLAIDVAKSVDETYACIEAQRQLAAQPYRLVVALDEQGQITQTSRLIEAQAPELQA